MAGWNYADIWETVAAAVPERPAQVHGQRSQSWAEFDRRANGVAQALLDAGLQRQSKVAAYLYKLHESNLDFRQYTRSLITENKFRAVRYGLDGNLIDFGKQQEAPSRDLIEEMLALIDPVVDELGSREAIDGIRKILKTGTGADRQLKVFEESKGDLKAVVDYMAEETRAGL